MPSPAIELKHVTKHYGSARGIADISLTVDTGQVFGFLGPNGAGKSTTINLLIDLIRPSEGSIKIFDTDIAQSSVEVRRKIGFLTGDMALDGGLTGKQQLTYFAHLRGIARPKRIHELAQLLNLDLSHKIKTLSRGNRQKVGLISALMHDPELLILDEPTTGLDPLGQAQFNKLILDNKQRGRTTFLSSHLLSEVQEICDDVAFIREGKIIHVQHMRDITAGSPKHVRIVSADATLKASLKKLPGGLLTASDHNTIALTFSGDINQLLQLLAKHKVHDVTITEADLETVFMEYYQGK